MPAPLHRLRAALRAGVAAFLAVPLLVAAARPSAAQVGSDRYSSITVDAATGDVLSAAGADEYRFPASLTKMMTLYMLFEALRDRRLGLEQPVPVSAYAASMSPTKLGLVPGSYITVEQALLGLVTKSANDAAAALGELMGGDEDRFAQMMTLRARGLGMTRTTFRNASGLPDWEQVTTARDMATLARRLVQDFPAEYRYFSTPYFVFRGRTIHNHDRMLQTYPGADGLKTGYITASGYNLVTSAVRADTRLIGVVMGAANSGERDLHMAALLDQGFDHLGVPAVFVRREPPSLRLPLIAMARAEAAPLARLRALPAEQRPVPPRTATRRGRSAEDAAPTRRVAEARGERAQPGRQIVGARVVSIVAPTREAKPVGEAKPSVRPGPAPRAAAKAARGRGPG